MLGTLITSKTRVKLLLKFFLNPHSISYLRSLEHEFGESTNAIRLELNRFEDAGMLESFMEGNKKMFQANTRHPLFRDIQNIVMKYVGVDKIIETIADRLGDLKQVYLIGDYARGVDSGVIDLVLVGHLNNEYLLGLVAKAENIISRKIRFLIYSPEEYLNSRYGNEESLLVWNA